VIISRERWKGKNPTWNRYYCEESHFSTQYIYACSQASSFMSLESEFISLFELLADPRLELERRLSS
jgi:hypothetical protein